MEYPSAWLSAFQGVDKVIQAAQLRRELGLNLLRSRFRDDCEGRRVNARRAVDDKIDGPEACNGGIDGSVDFVAAIQVGLEHQNIVSLGTHQRQPPEERALLFRRGRIFAFRHPLRRVW